ncbi:D-lactate dehydrogenase [Pseudaquabacterium rugosum]|uniref:Quinone-dependent D-lactate dehydrogenase n=1 Tax=Pseudaquabacterium rugosum TaxID=2984194 RepID=A0ABU9BCD7_9BURK
MSSTEHALIARLRGLPGAGRVETDARRNEHYRRGFRSGSGAALAVVFPETLVGLWRVLQACVDAGVIIILQAAKTGLTEGSAPSGDDYDRPVVVVNVLGLDGLRLLNGGHQVLALPGATLHGLESRLKAIGRAPHSVIGSSCLGASVIGGVANNSGGALVKRGPAYTEMALYAQVTAEGRLELVNHLGIELGDAPETMLQRLADGDFRCDGLDDGGFQASDREYAERLRDVDADTPARYNADVRRLYEASGCAGKLAVFAVRLDTFAVPAQDRTFYIGTNDAQVLTRLRRHLLSRFTHLPDVGEYLHREAFDIAERYGKDTFVAIQKLGTARMPRLFAAKGRIDATLNKLDFLPRDLSDRLLQFGSQCLPQHLPGRMLDFRERHEHHLILKMSDAGIAEAQAFLPAFFADPANEGDFFECTPEEAAQAYLHRFAVAGAAIRLQTVRSAEVGGLIALDIALRRNDVDWVERLPPAIADQIEHTLIYGHFLCHVFHQDYVLKKGADADAVKHAMLDLLDGRGAKYPAEHNVGHLYEAEPGLQGFYRRLDPTNTFNPGIGKTDRRHRRHCLCAA